MEAENLSTAELQAAITRWFTKMSELREKMRRSDTATGAARQETLANLADIAEALADLRAA